MSILSQRIHGPVVGVLFTAAALLVVCPGAAQEPTAAGTPGYTGADVAFMQNMMAHHAQAMEMTALVPSRTERADVRRLAARMEISQEDELSLMRGWLEQRGEAIPDAHAQHGAHGGGGAGHRLMPGMLGAHEMRRLREARGEEFDRLFLESMIRHHEGALVMVAELLATDGAGQEPEIFQFASHVDSDQRIEIARMRRMLDQRRSSGGI